MCARSGLGAADADGGQFFAAIRKAGFSKPLYIYI